ncbi:gliding motility protein [unidentified eubacterium SCB49]|nr:gliding motility protein [unidentified eubacterium SCB49]
MKNYVLIFCLLLLVGCEDDNKIEAEIAQIPMDVKITRFDKIFAEAELKDLPRLKKEYSLFFPKQVPDSIWQQRLTDTIQEELDVETAKVFPDDTKLNEVIHPLFQHFKYYFPEFKSPTIYTVTSDVDYQNKVIAADSLLVISIDNYLGADHFFYEGISGFISQNLKPSRLGPDIADVYARQLISVPQNRTLLAQMIYYGKALYLTELVSVSSTEAEVIGYTEDQMLWTKENEIYMWRYFVEKELLYSTDDDLPGRFLNPAPFSKFYLEIDNESPGRLGRYIGWQIVRAYMDKNPDVTIAELLKKPANEIYIQSKYKPKKD